MPTLQHGVRLLVLSLSALVVTLPATASSSPQPGDFRMVDGDEPQGQPAIDGETIVWGSFTRISGRSASAYVYRRVAGTWVAEGILAPSVGGGFQTGAVALSGNTAAVAWVNEYADRRGRIRPQRIDLDETGHGHDRVGARSGLWQQRGGPR